MTACKPKTNIDLVLYNGKIYTVDSLFSTAEAMAVNNGKIVATGTTTQLQQQYNAEQTINLQGKFVYPGFIDAHCHFYGLALELQEANLKGATSFQMVIDRLKLHNQTYNPKWLLGNGWDQNLWQNKQFPENTLLNQTFPNIPVVLSRIDGHAVIANNTALKIAEIDANTKINGGEVVLKNGKPTGVLIDKAAELLDNKIPHPPQAELIKLLMQAEKSCLAVGLTTLADAGLSKSMVMLYDKMQKKNQLNLKIYAMLDPSTENIEYFVKKGIYQTQKLHVCSIKLYADGALGSRGACLLKPYTDDPKNYGLMVESPQKLAQICELAYQYGYQINTHAIGDSANRIILDIYAHFLKQTNNRRWRIEHVQFVDSADFTKFKTYSIIPSVQPTHATSDMYWAAQRLGPKRIKFAYAYKKLLQQNAWIAFGTDFPIENIAPLLTFYAAVFRKDLNGFPAQGFQTQNAVSRQQALQAITIWAARACFEETQKGSLELGKAADFVILNKDILTVSEKDILQTIVLKTYIDGKKVYSSSDDGN